MQNRKVLLVIAAIIVLAAGVWTVNLVLGEPETASAPIRSVPLELESTATAVPPTEMAPPGSTAGPTQQSAPPLAEPTETPATRPVIFEIRQDETEVRFTLNEVLRGEPKTVVGTSNQVAGQMAVDLADLSTAQIGLIQVNARTLATDNNFRNRLSVTLFWRRMISSSSPLHPQPSVGCRIRPFLARPLLSRLPAT